MQANFFVPGFDAQNKSYQDSVHMTSMASNSIWTSYVPVTKQLIG